MTRRHASPAPADLAQDLAPGLLPGPPQGPPPGPPPGLLPGPPQGLPPSPPPGLPAALLAGLLLLTAAGAAPEPSAQPPVRPAAAAAAAPAAPEPVEPALGMRLRRIPAGGFLMGSAAEEAQRDTFEQQHTVRLTRDFLIGVTEVTQGQWQRLMGRNPSFFNRCGAECPVEMVNWYEIAAFANALSARAGFERCYVLDGCSGTLGGGCAGDVHKCAGDYQCGIATARGPACAGYRLPTEAEWEYAARAGAGGAVPAGSLELRGKNDAPALDPVAWYAGNSGVAYLGGVPCAQWSQTERRALSCGPHPVGGKAPSAWGLHDMQGNVMEMVEDQAAWSAAAGRLVTDTYREGIVDPWSRAGDKHVVRGGSWYSFPRFCRFAWRGSTHLPTRLRTVGFRLARTAPAAP